MGRGTQHASPIYCVFGETRMDLDQKLKTALDESRLLILGAQVLFGFAFQAVFQDCSMKCRGSASFCSVPDSDSCC